MEKLNEAVYLINDERYLHLRENSAGVGFATYNKVTGEPLESGQISEKNLPPDGRNMMAAARNWYLFVLSEDERKVIQLESIKILESVPASGIHKRRIWEPETMPKDIRLINSHYDDLYRIPDGGVIQVDYPDGRSFTAKLEHLFQHGIVLLATSNYPPEMLLPNPLYHDRFLPSIALIRAHLTVVALNGEEDYRERHLSQDNAFCSGRMWVNPNAQQRQLYDLPSLPGEPVSLTVGYRTLLAAAASPALLHFTFTQLCQAATAVMDYLTLCESYAVWLLDEVPPLATVGPAAQQRFINVIDVLYEKQIRLLLVTRCDLETLVAGVELEDIQRTRSRLQQLPRAV